MASLIAVAAFGRVQGLTNEECVALYGTIQPALPDEREQRILDLATLRLLDRVVMEIKLARAQGLRDRHQPVMTHDQWAAQRQGCCSVHTETCGDQGGDLCCPWCPELVDA